MDWIYIFIVVVLGILAISDIVVGVSNDAVNFLNSAFGSKVAKRKVILTIASFGIMLGVLTSSGMMEVARSGVFYPSQFTFADIMMLFLGVMLSDVILLNLFNSMGLPTSTTVSLVFELLGASVAIAIYHIKNSPDLGLADLSHYINSGKALVIISAILISVLVAFIGGTIIMYISRLLFSFRYKKPFAKFGALWCGISLTGIVYFAVFKGLKSSGLISSQILDFTNEHIYWALLILWVACSALLFILQRCKVNILKITILAGTFSLALAFAGNDLVNFIGVPLAGFDSYTTASASGNVDMTMESLTLPAKANFVFLFIAGLVMVLTLFFSKKAMHVTETELKLSSQNEGDEKFGSTIFSRALVRFALNVNNIYDTVTPKKLRKKIDNRFTQLPTAERGNAFYDLIRGTVNLSAASILISMATSLKLPLSTTYVVFMVAMGSSLADRAWGRESAVYRITGVMTVISGWFITALAGFLISLIVASALIWGGNVMVVLISLLCGYIVIYENFFSKRAKKSKEKVDEETKIYKGDDSENVLVASVEETSDILGKITKIYNRTLVAVFKENRKVLKDMVKESNNLYLQSKQRKYEILPTLKQFNDYDIETSHFYVQVVDYISEVTKALLHITRPCFDHINNNHEGFNKEQVFNLMQVNDEVEKIYIKAHEILQLRDFTDLDLILKMRDELFVKIADAIKDELKRIQGNESRTKASMLYLNILTETKTMILQYRNLLKSQKYFLESKDGYKINKIDKVA